MSRKAILSLVGLVVTVMLVVATFVALYFFQRPVSFPPVVISEVMSSNGSTIQDSGGDFSDWVEIHNPNSESIQLEGYILSRNQSDLWVFPEISLEPGGYLLVWASGKSDSVTTEPHTQFRLSRDGVSLEMVAPDGETRIDFVAVPSVHRDRSFGVSRDQPGVLCFFANPTPGAANSEECLDAAKVQ